jgi:exodeoxyribonuclease-1
MGNDVMRQHSLHEADPEKLGQLKALYLYAQELVS